MCDLQLIALLLLRLMYVTVISIIIMSMIQGIPV